MTSFISYLHDCKFLWFEIIYFLPKFTVPSPWQHKQRTPSNLKECNNDSSSYRIRNVCHYHWKSKMRCCSHAELCNYIYYLFYSLKLDTSTDRGSNKSTNLDFWPTKALMWRSTGISLGGNTGTWSDDFKLCCDGWTTWLSPSNTPSANIITVRITVSLVVEIESCTWGWTCSLPGFTNSEVCSWVLAGMTPICDWSTSWPPTFPTYDDFVMSFAFFISLWIWLIRLS